MATPAPPAYSAAQYGLYPIGSLFACESDKAQLATKKEGRNATGMWQGREGHGAATARWR